MSATGRSDVRHANDFYRTPEWCTRAILPYLPTGGTILDAGCGDGAILSVLVSELVDGVVLGVEIDPALAGAARGRVGPMQDGLHAATVIEDDFLCWDQQPVDLIIANPPFSLAEEFVEVALEATGARHGVVAMLLRLGWMAGQKRSQFHLANPSDVYVLSRRPSFTGGGTDSSEYAWFVWGPGRGGRWSVLEGVR